MGARMALGRDFVERDARALPNATGGTRQAPLEPPMGTILS